MANTNARSDPNPAQLLVKMVCTAIKEVCFKFFIKFLVRKICREKDSNSMEPEVGIRKHHATTHALWRSRPFVDSPRREMKTRKRLTLTVKRFKT